MKPSRRMWILVALAAVNAVVWIIPSDVVELVARERPVLLGRYSHTHFFWLVGLAAASIVAVCLVLPRTAAARKQRAFRLAACVLFGGLTAVTADGALRLAFPAPYVLDGPAFHRRPHATTHVIYNDRPERGRSYPTIAPGFGRVECTLVTDGNGFRNSSDLRRADVIALGDSFTEGSRVSTEAPWPVRLGTRTGLTICNLGMSGYSPQQYVAVMMKHGMDLAPQAIVCMLYEGNDFRDREEIVAHRPSFKNVLRTSPLLHALEEMTLRSCGAIGSDRPVAGLDALSWMPLRAPDRPDGRYYAFAPKQVLDLLVDPATVEREKEWRICTRALGRLAEGCRQAHTRLMVAYAPVKAHVVLPLVVSRLPAEKVRMFLAMRSGASLPEANGLVSYLAARLDNRERMVSGWCRQNGIAFLSLTEPLRAAAARGEQVYYTYDQHWTPLGHEVAAAAIHDTWRREFAALHPVQDGLAAKPTAPGK